MNKYKITIIFLIVAILFSACTSPFYLDLSQQSSQVTSDEAFFHFIDVGQGDCTLIQGENTNILIDSGTYEGGYTAYNYLKDIGVNRIDYFISTHPHEDHLGGAATIISGIKTENVFINGNVSNSDFFDEFLDVLEYKNITPKIPDTGCIYEIGPFRIKFLSPVEDFEDENNNSLVFTVQFKNTKALFTGDAERKVEGELLKNPDNLYADILKVGHHGSRNASSATFLNAVCPTVSVIQCGEGNSYGHPHDEALKRLTGISSAVFRTDRDKTVILRTDGNTVEKIGGEKFERKLSSINVTYIGNKKSRVFHSEACPNLPSDKNSVKFSSREDAINSGYKVCGNCNP